MKKSNIYTSDISLENKNILSLSNLKKLKNTENINYFDLVVQTKESYFITLEDNNYLIGLISLAKTDEKEWLIQSIDIAENERKKGNAKILIKSFFEFVEKNITDEIKQSSYSRMGLMYISKIFNDMAKNYPTVKFIDNGKIGFHATEKEILEISLSIKKQNKALKNNKI